MKVMKVCSEFEKKIFTRILKCDICADMLIGCSWYLVKAAIMYWNFRF